MNKELFSKKMLGLVVKQRSLRISLLLSGILLILLISLVITNISFSEKVQANEVQINDAKNQLAQLETIVNKEDEGTDPRVAGRKFASYDQIVPFISLLESLFAIIDKDSRILVRDKEEQIYINRYADYEIELDPGNKMPLLYKALEELQKSKYITKVTRFVMNYSPTGEGEGNTISEVNITIRLYFE